MEEIKLILPYEMTVHWSMYKHKKTTKKTLEPISKWNTVAGYKVTYK